MINWFLKARHWQIFLLLAVPVFILLLIQVIFIILDLQNNSDYLLAGIQIYLGLFGIVILFSSSVLFSWFWSIGVGLQSKLPPHVSMQTNRFKTFLLIPVIYIGVLLLGVFFIFYNSQSGMSGSDSPPLGLFFLIVPLHLFSIFCTFHTMYFIAKTIKSVELQRKATVGDYLGEFFMIWFYFIGIWILQPKINKLAEANPDISSGPLDSDVV